MKLTIDHLFSQIYQQFRDLADHRSGTGNTHYCLADCLMAAFAMFSLKCPSLLQFRHQLNIRMDNLMRIYHLHKVPGDTSMRSTIDGVDFRLLQSLFVWLIGVLRNRGLLHKEHRVKFSNTNSFMLVSVDGTGHFCSCKNSCKHCLTKKHRNGKTAYYHQCLGAVLAHPTQKTVFPVAVEPIIQQDGVTKNDCEQNGFKRILPQISAALCEERAIILLDGLYQNGPCIQAITELRAGKKKWSYIIVCKENNFVQLQVKRLKQTDGLKTKTWQYKQKGKTIYCTFSYATDLILNGKHQDIKTHYFNYEEKDELGNILYSCDWITDLPIQTMTTDDCILLVACARTRWKIENETFNTLKNQGYHLEHNFGHGAQYLATNFGLLTFLAFTVDQIAQFADQVFQAALKACNNSRKNLWYRVLAVFDMAPALSMHAIYRFIQKKKLLDIPPLQ